MDALFGACAMGDIGKLFPDTDPRYSGADSMKLVDVVAAGLADGGFRVSNLDVTIIAQAPKLAPYIDKMRANLAVHLHLPLDRVSVKATTEEHLGFTGRGEGIAVHAVTLVEEPEVCREGSC